MGKKRDHATFASDDTAHASQALNTLDQNYPRKIHHTSIKPYKISPQGSPPQSSSGAQSRHSYIASTSRQNTVLPALPPVNPGNLSTAPFTHPSAASARYVASSSSDTSKNALPPQLNYERLEFLGDAYIEIIATRIIYARLPHLLTGKQARVREALVRNSTLAEFATKYGFGERIIGDKIILANGQGSRDHEQRRKSKGPKPKTLEKLLADVFEAFVAAVVLSNIDNDGFGAAERWLEQLWAPLLLNPEAIFEAEAAALAPLVPSPKHESRPDAVQGSTSAGNGAKQEPKQDSEDSNENWKDQLQSAISTREVRISYVEEAIALPADLHLRSKEEQFHTKQLRRVLVYVALDDLGGEVLEGSLPAILKTLRSGQVHIGHAVGKGRKEAGMLAARDALRNGGEIVTALKVRKANR